MIDRRDKQPDTGQGDPFGGIAGRVTVLENGLSDIRDDVHALSGEVRRGFERIASTQRPNWQTWIAAAGFVLAIGTIVYSAVVAPFRGVFSEFEGQITRETQMRYVRAYEESRNTYQAVYGEYRVNALLWKEKHGIDLPPPAPFVPPAPFMQGREATMHTNQ